MSTTRLLINRYMSSATLRKLNIENVSTINQFRLKLENGDYATIKYNERNDIYDLIHTDVPPALQGKGIGAIIAEKTFEYIIKEDKRMVITCDYLMNYYRKNKDKFKSHVIEE